MTRSRALAVTALALAIGVIVDVTIGATSPYPGYAASIGLFGCIAIILVSKWLGAVLLQRSETYYPDDEPADEQADLRGPQHG